MKTAIIIYACYAVVAAAAMAVCTYFQEKSRVLRILTSIIYALTFAAMFFAMMVLEGKYGMKILHSSIIALLVLALVYLGELAGKRLANKNKEDEE